MANTANPMHDIAKALASLSFVDEKDGQIAWFTTMNIFDKVVFNHSTDGIMNSTIFEFKKTIVDEEKVLSQAVNYLSKIRIAGEPVPMHILLVDLGGHRIYHYGANPFSKYINALPQGPSSLASFIHDMDLASLREEIDYTTIEGVARIYSIVYDTSQYFKVKVDDTNIISLAHWYYNLPQLSKKVKKGDFWCKENTECEVKTPNILAPYIEPYTGDGSEFNYIMDKLNPKALQKQVGAFYTPDVYAKITAEWVRYNMITAMGKTDEDGSPYYKDYIILDRCAGTGNLEAALDDWLLKYCVVGTYELQEYYHLVSRLGDKVRAIIPGDISQATIDDKGLIKEGDACSEEYYQKLKADFNWDDERVFKIVLENPPYADCTSGDKLKKGTEKIQSWLVQKMKEVRMGKASNDISHQFIWSCENILKPDRYIVYSPAKYWSVYGLMCNTYKPLGHFIANRKAFHATEGGICVMCWHKGPMPFDKLCFNIVEEDGTQYSIHDKRLVIQKAGKTVNEGWLNGTPINQRDDVYCSGLDGRLRRAVGKKVRVKPKTADNMLGDIMTSSNTFSPLNIQLSCKQLYGGNDRILYDDNIMQNLPFFVTTMYESIGDPDWWDRGTHTRGAGKTDEWRADSAFLNKCFMYSMLTASARGRSVKDCDGNILCINQLNFDTDTWASNKYEQIKTVLPEKLVKLKTKFDAILALAKTCDEYDPTLRYNLYQICEEINTSYKTDGKDSITIYNHPDLNAKIKNFKADLKEYYRTDIVPDLFRYELIR